MKKGLIQKTAEAPAEMLEKTIEIGEHLNANLPAANGAFKKSKAYWHMLGPGLTTGAADDDPAGTVTYSQTGAKYGFQLLWLSVLTFPIMSIVQEMCARVGLVTGRGLAGNIRVHFSRKILYLSAWLLFGANAFNIGADLGAMAKTSQLILPHANFVLLLVGLTLTCLFLQIFTPYARYARYLKWLAMVLFAYVASALMAHIQWHEVFRHAVVPSLTFSKDQILLVCAILGTTISPYLFFWQTSQEIEEQILMGRTNIKLRQRSSREEMKSMRIDVWSGMLLSNIVMFFIIAACGAVLFSHGITEITSASQAAEALRPFAGNSTYFLFTIGILGTGLLAIPVLAGSSSYALAESFKWQEGLYRNLKQAHAFYGIIILSLLVGLGINFIGIDPIKALIYSAVANGIIAPVILALIVLLSSNKKIMGEWVNKPSTTFIGWIITGLMALSGIAAIIAMF
ncbi:MAG TPA: divalent metal cation transporter [Candidatus Saccharimonadales bacterium]|nr:divalent metal cation transporter [Candidatus Saccharimonadales bacterium]